jgi:hypothetical protein
VAIVVLPDPPFGFRTRMRCMCRRAYAAACGMASICDLTHVPPRGSRLDFRVMEWVLQVADEFDDAFGVLRHGWLGLVADIGALLLVEIKIL